jgi:hypothetical protein
MFFFIGGIAPRAVTVGSGPADAICPACGAVGALERRRVDSVLSLFFVDVLTVKRGARTFDACRKCGWTSAGRGGRGGDGADALAPGADDGGWRFCPFCGAVL